MTRAAQEADYKLVRLDGAQTVSVPAGEALVLGRASTSDRVVRAATISRRHATLRAVPGGIELDDLGSHNGTRVNGRPVTRATLVPGDVVSFGQVAFSVEAPPDASPAPVEPDAEVVLRRRVSGSDPVRIGEAPPSATSRIRIEAEQDAERESHKLHLLLEASREFSQHRDVDQLLEKVVDVAFAALQIDLASVLLLDPGSGKLVPRVSRCRVEGANRRVPTSIPRRTMEERAAIVTCDAPSDQRFGGRSILLEGVHSAICVPLLDDGERFLGALYLDASTRHAFSDEDLEFVVAFAGIAAVSLANRELSDRLERERHVRSNLQRYFAPDLVDEISASHKAVKLGGERKAVAVLFSDIRGFTSLAETMAADDTASLLNEYFSEMVEVVFRHGGTLDKFIGDGVMALWGAPVAHADDADRSLRAAIDMQQTLDDLNARWRAANRPALDVGIGLAYGEVFAGNIGSEHRLEYTVIGDTVNTASRLCSRAAAGEIIAAETLCDQLKRPLPLTPLEPVELKGKRKQVRAFRVDAGD